MLKCHVIDLITTYTFPVCSPGKMLSRVGGIASRASRCRFVTSRSLATVSSGNVDTSGIPVIDFANFGSLSFGQRRGTAQEIVDGFKTVGFVYLKNHGISEEVIQEAFKRVRSWFLGGFRCSSEYVQSDEFFRLPLEKKASTHYVQRSRPRTQSEGARWVV